ncbi:MAG: MBL fold metallo-hydrolase [Candidatus Thermoplasmatota archaeon]|nr:MBL fold metallo-hydrolase [Candidatus Thermoplasmatota archaeon]
MRIRWHGHSCFEVGGSVVVVTDPHDGKSLGIPAPDVSADLVLISHDHFDHNCSDAVRGPDTSILKSPVLTVERGVRVEGMEADHDADKGRKRGKVTIFRFELDGFTFCHLGDLGTLLDEPSVEKISPVDFLFVPVGDVFTIGPVGAKAVIDAVQPKVAVPMHYRYSGLGLAIQPLQNFLKICDKEHIVRVGNEVEFSREDLPESGTEIWVFSS